MEQEAEDFLHSSLAILPQQTGLKTMYCYGLLSFFKTCMGVLPVEVLDPPELELKMVSLHADECRES